MDTIRVFYPIVSKLVSQLPAVRDAADIQTKLGLSEKKLPTFKPWFLFNNTNFHIQMFPIADVYVRFTFTDVWTFYFIQRKSGKYGGLNVHN